VFQYDTINNKLKTVIHFKGDLDIEATELFEHQLTPELFQYQDIQINFSKVLFVDSSGIGLLITMINQLRETGKTIVIVQLEPEVKEIFSYLQLPLILGEEVFADL